MPHHPWSTIVYRPRARNYRVRVNGRLQYVHPDWLDSKGRLTESAKRTLTMIKRKPEDYTSNFLTRNHQPITTFKSFKKWNYEDMFLFYKDTYIGEGGFEIVSKKKAWLHTEGVRLDKKYQQKGHGIHLYHHLISTAVKIGCKRLYSSTGLNKYSRRMWSEKLPKFYKVVPVMTRACCHSCGSKKPRVLKFYIDLDSK